MSDYRNWVIPIAFLMLMAAYCAVCYDMARNGYKPVIDSNGGVHWEKPR